MIRLSAVGVILVSACAGAFSPVHAAPPASFPVTGSTQSHCSLGSATGPLVLTTTVASNGKLDPSLDGRTFTIAGVFCNSPSTIRVSATELRRTPPQGNVPPGHSQAANFTATATGWASTPATVTTTETSNLGSPTVFTGVARSQPAPKSGSITVTVNNFKTVGGTPGNSHKLVNGNYSATITISLTPVI